jgi:hypothetical protein
MNLRVERTYPLYLALISSALWYWFKPKFPSDEKEFLAAALSLGAILTGFIATAKAILAAMPDETVMGRLRKSGYIQDLITYLAQALYGCLTFSVLCLVGFFLRDEKAPAPLPLWFATTWIFLGVFSMLAFHRVSRLLFKILKRESA